MEMRPNHEDVRADVVEPVVEPDAAAAAPWFEKFEKYCIYQSNRLEQTRGSLMTVAPAIAAICFQGVVSPPGGLWQREFTSTTSPYSCREALCLAGTSVLADSHPVTYKNFMVINAVACFSSLSVGLLIVAGALIAAVYLMFASQITPYSMVDDIWRTAWKCVFALLSVVTAIGLLTKACRIHFRTRQFRILTWGFLVLLRKFWTMDKTGSFGF